MPRRGRVLSSVVVILGLSALLSACAAESDARLPVTLPAKNLETWAMPLDGYSKSESQTQAESYADRVQDHHCMTAAGFEYPISWEPTTIPPSRTFTGYGTKLFSLSIAQQFGYHPEPSDDTLSQDLRKNEDRANQLVKGPQWEKQFHECVDESRKGPLARARDPQNYNGLWIDVSQSVRKSDGLRGLAAKWRECMVKVGVPDLPDTPDDMPTESMKRQFLAEPAVVDSGASQRELEVAVADATCQNSTGYVRTLYDRMWDGQVKVLREHLDELEAGKRLIEKNAERAAKVIDLYAPPAPANSP